MSWEQDLEQVGKDPEASARLLLVVAGYLRRGEVLPAALSNHVAGAFEVAGHKATEGERIKMLGCELGLVRDRVGRPTKATVEDARLADIQVGFSDDLPWTRTNVEKWIMLHKGVKERTAAELVKKLQQQRDREVDGLRADMTAGSICTTPQK